MEILASSNPKHDLLFCQIRSQWVKATPEEQVRQSCLHFMIHELGYPVGHIVLEKGLSQMPHLALKQGLPSRRADILCFAKNLRGELYPLVVVECKAVKITDKVVNQVTSYNQFLGASFVAIVNAHQSKMGWYDVDKQKYIFQERFFCYSELIEGVTN